MQKQWGVTMPEYKDITGLKKEISDVKRELWESCCQNRSYITGYISALSYVEGMIASLPAADVEPVKHGRWIFKERIKLMPTRQIVVEKDGTELVLKKHITEKVPYCSICGEHGDCEEDATPYCPDCGAKMDGESND